MEMIEIGGFTVTKDWAEAQTATRENAAAYLAWAEENIRRGYFPRGHAEEAGFIRAKYPGI